MVHRPVLEVLMVSCLGWWGFFVEGSDDFLYFNRHRVMEREGCCFHIVLNVDDAGMMMIVICTF